MRAPTFIPLLLSVSLFGTYITALPAPQQDSNNENIEKFSVTSTTTFPSTSASATPFANANADEPARGAQRPDSVTAVETTPVPPANGDGPQELPHSTDPVDVKTITRPDRTIQMYIPGFLYRSSLLLIIL